jgi:hypothetical protein
MKYYEMSYEGEVGQHVVEIFSEAQIIKSYFPYWCTMMCKVGRGHEVNEKRCIEDWCVIHWAVEVPKPEGIS